jgi:hypothetical protein
VQEPYRPGSLGDLIEMMVDGWSVARLHYADRRDPADPRAAAFVTVTMPGEDDVTLCIPDDDRAFSDRSLVALFRESPRIWKHRSPETIQARLAEAARPSRPEAESWGDIPDPWDQPLDISPASLLGVAALAQVETIDRVTVALLSLERYREVSRLRYIAHTADTTLRGGLGALDVLVVDERGRRYRSASLDVERSGNRLEGVIAVTPGIPVDVVDLTVTIGTLGAAGPDGALGPWVFPIRLPAPLPG